MISEEVILDHATDDATGGHGGEPKRRASTRNEEAKGTHTRADRRPVVTSHGRGGSSVGQSHAATSGILVPGKAPQEPKSTSGRGAWRWGCWGRGTTRQDPAAAGHARDGRGGDEPTV